MKKIISLLLTVSLGLAALSACGKEPPKPPEADFSGIASVCELATLKCYYHNVAKAEKPASGLLSVLGTGYKKIWTEYSGVVELGIDVNQVKVEKPTPEGVVKITIPQAKLLNIDLDTDSMAPPLTDRGLFTSITKEEETEALAAAQENMEKTARENTALLAQARERAKELIEGYVKNVGAQIGKEFKVEWVEK